MNVRIAVLVLASLFSTVVTAREDVVGALAHETGLSRRDVKMVLGAHSGHAEYLASYDQTRRRFVRALGEARYDQLMAGKPILLQLPDQRVAVQRVSPPSR